MVLAAGFGKRVNPLTLKVPKPLLKIGNETLLSNTLKFLELNDIKEVVINVHYLSEQIINFINKNKYNFSIKLIEEKNQILDTGGGIFNAIKHFSNRPFLVINPDTIWDAIYLKKLKLMEDIFFENKKNKCSLMLVNKNKSFDKSLKGDFNLKKNVVYRANTNDNKYIYVGLQIIDPAIFSSIDNKIFSINEVWDNLIKKKELYGLEVNVPFFHISSFDIYQKILIEKY